ncbi:hypothetical protein GCM10007862_31030 [Dyella lipolytica]|nr:hypothetical protein GCM10007862_31030 [Dyella lipolytica]
MTGKAASDSGAFLPHAASRISGTATAYGSQARRRIRWRGWGNSRTFTGRSWGWKGFGGRDRRKYDNEL